VANRTCMVVLSISSALLAGCRYAPYYSTLWLEGRGGEKADMAPPYDPAFTAVVESVLAQVAAEHEFSDKGVLAGPDLPPHGLRFFWAGYPSRSVYVFHDRGKRQIVIAHAYYDDVVPDAPSSFIESFRKKLLAELGKKIDLGSVELVENNRPETYFLWGINRCYFRRD
jgi:hypothetical protein